MTDATVRYAAPVDVTEIATLANATAGAPQWTNAQYSVLLEESKRSKPTHAVFVAETDSKLQGFCFVGLAADQAELESIVVASDARRVGIGKMLSLCALGWAKKQGAQEMWLEVRASNTAARTLYHLLGFEEAGHRHAYYSNPHEDAVLMRAILCDATHI